jgi:hypothetical protein
MGRLEDRIRELEERVRILELCLTQIEKRLKIRRKAVPRALAPPTGKPVRTGRPNGPVQR